MSSQIETSGLALLLEDAVLALLYLALLLLVRELDRTELANAWSAWFSRR